ncbi:hypothetical protein ACFY4C_13800 [Actinomadura viridis]|uniref:hypothetical protein n=1 Tax=Actinomadura viridis TaxID=58110 RepID=UPI0036CE876A
MAFLVIPFLGISRDRGSIALGYSPDAGEAGVVFAYRRVPAVLLGLAVFMAGIASMVLLGVDDPAVSHRAAWIAISIPICFMGGALGLLFSSLSKVVILSPASNLLSR